MDFMISLAHFCEVHGPTSILCTQVLPVSCLTCYPPPEPSRHEHFEGAHPAPASWLDSNISPPETYNNQRTASAPTSRAPSFSRRSGSGTASQRSALLNQHIQQQSCQHTQATRHNSASSSSVSSPRDTPPTSPRSPHLPSPEAFLSGSLGGDAGGCNISKRYTGGKGHGAGGSGSPTSSTDSCANCSLSLPKSVSEQLPEGAPGSPTKDGKGKNGSPVLRTREAFIAGEHWAQEDSDHGHARRSRAKTRKDLYRRASRPSSSSPPKSSSIELRDGSSGDSPDPSDDDNVLQSSTELDPAVLNPDLSRTVTSTATSTSHLSDEQLHQQTPTGPHSHTLTYLTTRNPPSQTAYSLLRRSCIRTLSCELLPRAGSGPLVFGDPQAGYTIAYVFRIRDPRARGGRRGYALICLAGRDARRVMRAVPLIMRWFESTASWIVSMADRETNAANSPTSPASNISQSPTNTSTINYANATGTGNMNITPVTSFLSGRSHDPDGFLRRATETRAKGLAELVGRENFFVELHAVFVRLLGQLGRMLGGLDAMAEPLDSGFREKVGGVGLERGMDAMKIKTAGVTAEKERMVYHHHRARGESVDVSATSVSVSANIIPTTPAITSKTANLIPDMHVSRTRHLDTRLRQESVA